MGIVTMMLQQANPEINCPDSPAENDMAVRSLLMRLYRSRLEGQAYYPAQFVNGHAAALLEAGWIVERGQGYRLTERGVQVWAAMVEPLIDQEIPAWANELRALVGKDIEMETKLSKVQRNILEKLAQAGGTLPYSAFSSGYGLNSLQRAALVTVIEGETVTITLAGRQALAWPPAANGSRPQPFAPPPEKDPQKDEPTPLPQAQCECDGCISKQVLDLLAERYPKVRELVEVMQRRQDLLDTLTT